MSIGVESLEDLSAFFDMGDFATEAVATFAAGGTKRMKGIFENPVASRSITSNMEVTTPEPTFVCRTVDAKDVREGDALKVLSTAYVVRATLTDGTGVSTLVLERD